MKHEDLGDIIKKTFKGVYTATIVPPDPFSSPSTSRAVKIPENAEDDTDDPEPADEGDIRMDYLSD